MRTSLFQIGFVGQYYIIGHILSKEKYYMTAIEKQ
jgi:hypothetical protein